jgi:hypothetical protein
MEPGVIFPCLLYRELLDISEEYNIQLEKEVCRLVSLTDKNTTFWGDDSAVLANPVFAELIQKIERAVEKYAKLVGVCRKFKLCKMWGTVNYKGDYHNIHTHGSSLISGVYYVNIPKHPDGYFLRFVYDKWTLLGNEWSEPIETNKLLLFEGWVIHAYDPNPSFEPKIAIAFNFE